MLFYRSGGGDAFHLCFLNPPMCVWVCMRGGEGQRGEYGVRGFVDEVSNFFLAHSTRLTDELFKLHRFH